MAIPSFVHDELAALGIELPDELLQRMARYLALLLEANRRFNLTAVREADAAWRRHIIDSLTLLVALDELPEGSKVIDVGSGGGLPGIPIAIARPDLSMTLLEATGKKVNFLNECIAALQLPGAGAKAVQMRAEEAGQSSQFRQQFDAVICRAVGPLNELLEYTLPLAKVGGFVLAMKGPKVEVELAKAGDAMDILGGGDVQVFEAYPEGFEWQTVIVRIAKERPTPRTYPRLPGVPRQSPIGGGKF